MSDVRFNKLRALMAINDAGLRAAVRYALGVRGLKIMQEALELKSLRDALNAGQVDLLILSPELDGKDVSPLLQSMRQNKLGRNPFIVTMTLLDDPSEAVVRQSIDSGTDELLTTPLLPQQFIGSLDKFVQGRKAFVVTHNYVGPDRRSHVRPDTRPALMLDVPNPVRLQVGLDKAGPTMEQAVVAGQQQLKRQMLRRDIRQLEFLVEQMVLSLSDGSGLNQRCDLAGQVYRLLAQVGPSLGRALPDQARAELRELLQGLRVITLRWADPARQPKAEEIAVLPALAPALDHLLCTCG